jgi:putative transposase
MANTYTQLNIHSVFSVLGRENFLSDTFRSRLFEYIAGILSNKGHYPLSVNGYRDHVHIFFELKPAVSISKTMEEVKANSSRWINENNFLHGNFRWQTGYGSFSYSRSQRNDVIQYIMKQEKHHKRQTFKEEYLSLLNKFEVEYDERYLFEFYD